MCIMWADAQPHKHVYTGAGEVSPDDAGYLGAITGWFSSGAEPQ